MNILSYILSILFVRIGNTILSFPPNDTTDIFHESILIKDIHRWLVQHHVAHNHIAIVQTAIMIGLVIIFCLIIDFLTQRIFISIIRKIILKSQNKWDDILLQKKVCKRLSHFIPALFVYYSVDFALMAYPFWIPVVQSGVIIYMIIIALLAVNAFINAGHDIYISLPVSRNRPIKGFVQLLKIIFYLIAIILILSILLKKDVSYFLTGLGALTAILMFIFKDTLLGFVGGIQLSANDMVHPGDWITMPKYNADGTVTEISLHTVKVQNMDKTITMIPTYALVSDSFSNWRGMEEAGARKIQRSVKIDMNGIRFCDNPLLDKFEKIQLLTDYMRSCREEKKCDSIDHNAFHSDCQQLTNLGVFRKYLELYLKQRAEIRQDMLFIVRYLQPNETGLPVEVLVYTNKTPFAEYESVQSQIMEHILAILPEFELHIFQEACRNVKFNPLH